MDELPGIIIAVLLIFFAARYFLSRPSVPAHAASSSSLTNPHGIQVDSNGTPTQGPLKGVSQEMIENVHAAFPDSSLNAIVWSLSKTRSAQRTSEEILERGWLSEPPADFPKHPYLLRLEVERQAQALTSASSGTPTATSAASAALSFPGAPAYQKSLIERYNLSDRLTASASSTSTEGTETTTRRDKGKGRAIESDDDLTLQQHEGSGSPAPLSSSVPPSSSKPVATNNGWEKTKEGREATLKKRKEEMILQARRKLLEKQNAGNKKTAA